MERVFQIVAVILAGIAAYFLWQGNGDGAFVSGALGAVSFFLSVRFQVKERNKEREAIENPEPFELGEKNNFEEEFETNSRDKEFVEK